jgi:virginiamycin B lyase
VLCSWLLQQGHIAEKSVDHFLKDRDGVPVRAANLKPGDRIHFAVLEDGTIQRVKIRRISAGCLNRRKPIAPDIVSQPWKSAGYAELCLNVAAVAGLAILAISSGRNVIAAEAAHTIEPRMISELKPTTIIHLGKTADWVAITPDAVWVGSTGPFAVNRIDPKTNTWTATVKLGGEPCAGLATGFGSLWVPLCGKPPKLAKVDLKSSELSGVFNVGPAAAESGVTTSRDSVWLVIDKNGSLARIDPDDGRVRQTIRVPAGSYNPLYAEGQIWVTRADGAELTSVDAVTGAVLSTTRTGPRPRFLTAGAGAVWTLNQGDGSLTRIDTRTRQVTHTTALGIPGKGGDISFGGGMIWTTVWKVPLSMIDGASAALLCRWVGPGGDSLGIGHGAIWLTDYHAGTISRIELKDALARCKGPA